MEIVGYKIQDQQCYFQIKQEPQIWRSYDQLPETLIQDYFVKLAKPKNIDIGISSNLSELYSHTLKSISTNNLENQNRIPLKVHDIDPESGLVTVSFSGEKDPEDVITESFMKTFPNEVSQYFLDQC